MSASDKTPLAGTPQEAVESALARIRGRDADVRAFIEIREAPARDAARQLEQAGQSDDRPLHGMPIAIKEIIDVAGALCPWGAGAHAGRRAEADATVVTRLRNAGAIIMGTVVSTEYAIADPGPTRNPHDLDRTPGGSSSGPAAAVASGMVKAAIGTQTVGSIVRPALYCGVPGFKPTFGLLPLGGVMPLSEPLDHLGIFADDWETVCRIFAALTGVPAEASHELNRCVKLEPPNGVDIKPASSHAMQQASKTIAEHEMEIVRLPALEELRVAADEIAYDFVAIGMAEHHGADLDRAADGMSVTAKALVERGRTYSETDKADLDERLNTLRRDADNLLQPGDVVLCDAIEDVAPYWVPHHTGPNRLQAVWSVLGLPTAAWTTMTDPATGMPVGVQLTCARSADAELLSLMQRLA